MTPVFHPPLVIPHPNLGEGENWYCMLPQVYPLPDIRYLTHRFDTEMAQATLGSITNISSQVNGHPELNFSVFETIHEIKLKLVVTGGDYCWAS